ncbi:MAG: HNH endonuclease [Pseudomonadota bacterium]
MAQDQTDPPLCALCLRPIPPDVRQSRHHLVPKLRGGKGGPTVLLHQICHNEIHATLTETELARLYATPDALRAHPHLAKFIAWVSRRDPGFYASRRGTRRGARTRRH